MFWLSSLKEKTSGLRKDCSDRSKGSKTHQDDVLGTQVCACTGCDPPQTETDPSSGQRDQKSSLTSAGELLYFHPHFFNTSNKLIERDRRGLDAAAKPRSVRQYSWTNVLQINADNKQKLKTNSIMASILSEKVTDFLLSNVWIGEIYKLNIRAVGLSWGDILAREMNVCLYVSLTVTYAAVQQGLESSISSPSRAVLPSAKRRKIMREEGRKEDDYGATADEGGEEEEEEEKHKLKLSSGERSAENFEKEENREQGDVGLSLIHI